MNNNGKSTQGFLYIECPKCGKVKSFSVYHNIDTFDCECGNRIPVGDLVGVVARCTKCGKKHRYQTNVKDPNFEIPCLGCGEPMRVWWDQRRQEYHPID